MRYRLASFAGRRGRFTARLDGKGSPKQGKAPKALLRDIAFEGGERVSDHVWVDGVEWAKGLPEGAEIAFDATIAPYRKASRRGRKKGDYRLRQTDYQLVRINRVAVLPSR